jgi:hypothetical protein
VLAVITVDMIASDDMVKALIAVYLIVALAFYFVSASGSAAH